MKRELKTLALLTLGVAAVWAAPLRSPGFYRAVGTSLTLLQEYAKLHVVTSLLPALLIAGAISAMMRKQAILRYLGPSTPGRIAYPAASLAGCLLAVCSCTVLPMFAGIFGAGAGIGPASTFLFAGPAINVLAAVMSARVLGPGLGAARLFSRSFSAWPSGCA